MSTIKCPVCETEHNEGIACPTCSFESHYSLSEEMSEKFKSIEQDRINNHIEWWKGHRQQISDLNDAIVAKEKEITTKQQEYDDLKQKYADLEKELEDKKLACEDLAKELADEKKKNEAMSKEVESLRKQIEALNQELEAERKKCEHCPRPQQIESQVICYLIQKEYGEITNVYPIKKGKTIVGKKPQTDEDSVNVCALVADSREIQETHFSIETFDDGTIIANRIGDNWGIDYEGNNVKTSPLQNETQIYIGKQLQLIIILI